jgi:hypothetical protein
MEVDHTGGDHTEAERTGGGGLRRAGQGAIARR